VLENHLDTAALLEMAIFHQLRNHSVESHCITRLESVGLLEAHFHPYGWAAGPSELKGKLVCGDAHHPYTLSPAKFELVAVPLEAGQKNCPSSIKEGHVRDSTIQY